MFLMFTRLLFISFLLFTSILKANEQLDHPLTLPEIVNIALETHPETRQAWWQANRAAAALGEARSAYYPRIDFDTGITHGRDFKFLNGPDTNYTIYNADLLLSMLLYDFGERKATVNAARMALLAANWEANWTLQSVMANVLDRAYAMMLAQETLQATLMSMGDAEKMLSVSEGLNRAGLSPISDVYTSQSTVAQMKMDVAQQRALLDIQRGKLAASMGLSADTCLTLATVDCMPAPQKQNITDLIALAQQRRADLAARQARFAESMARYDMAKAAYGPKLAFTGRSGYDYAVNDRANGVHYQVALNLDVPLFTGFENVYEKRIACADTQISVEELAQLELDISLEVLTHSRSLEAAQEMLYYAEDNLNSALKAYEGVLDKYQAGKERIAEVSNAQRTLAAARIRYSDIKTRWLVSLANLAYATGTIMEAPCK